MQQRTQNVSLGTCRVGALVLHCPLSRQHAAVLGIVMLSAASIGSVRAQNCWDTQSAQIVAHSAAHTVGNFELAGIAVLDQSRIDSARFRCTGTFLRVDQEKKYNYYCEVTDGDGETFILQNVDALPGGTLVYTGGGTGKYADLTGIAQKFTDFPFNTGGTLPGCDRKQAEFKLPLRE